LFGTNSRAQIRFTPTRQVLHGPSPMQVSIHDDQGIRSNYKLVVRHNGLDVTTSFLRQATVTQSEKDLSLNVPVIRLTPREDHRIEIVYSSDRLAERSAYAKYDAPVCRSNEIRHAVNLYPYRPSNRLIEMIDTLSTRSGFNPAMITALVAQESAFHTHTVSWAKAIGLTQITPAAENEVSTVLAGWLDYPKYPGINVLPTPWIKMLVLSGRIHSGNEWRLDSERSIRGGLAYTHFLATRWSTPENMSRIQNLFEDSDLEYTKLVLASYNSGYARVQGALTRLGPAWITAPELREARRYVNRIMSFCDHFSENSSNALNSEETPNENKT
jgi:hypothetical protein